MLVGSLMTSGTILPDESTVTVVSVMCVGRAPPHPHWLQTVRLSYVTLPHGHV